MSTTNLFVELIVIGVGALIWLTLLVFALFGYAWVPADTVLSLPALVPVLSIIYVLGIVTDRLADMLFEGIWKGKLRRRYYRAEGTDYNDRRLIYVRSERLADLLEYGRSRMRICRGWALNTLLTMICLNWFLGAQVADPGLRWQLMLASNLLLAALLLCLWFSWRSLVITDYRKVRDQADFLRAEEANEAQNAAGVESAGAEPQK